MKKIICVLMCLILCFSLSGCTSPFEVVKNIINNLPISQEKDDFNILEDGTGNSELTSITQNEFRGKDVSGAVGDTVEVIFELGKETPIAAADFILEFDSTTLEYVETKQIYQFKSGYVMGNSPESGKAKVALVTLDPPTDGGDIFSVSFKILKDCKDGSEIKLSTSSCCDENYKKIELSCKGAKIFSK